jgi:hypothetical protein
MAQSRSTRRWDPFRTVDLVGALWSAATAVPPVSTGTAAAYRTLLLTVRRLAVGRAVTVHLDAGDVTMTVTEMESRLDVRKIAVGQLDDVRLVTTDITWATSRFERAEAILHDVRLLPGTPPVVVAAPVELSLDIPTSALEHLLLLAAPRLTGHVGADGVARLHWARRPAMGHVEVDATLDGAALYLKGRGLTLRGHRWRLPPWTPAYRFRLPLLPHGLVLTDVEFEPELLRVRGTLPQWRIELSRRRLEDLLDGIVGQRWSRRTD